MAVTTVKGTVTRSFHKGLGAEITESYMLRGEKVNKRWSCWFESEHGLTEGQDAEVSGLHSDQVDAWETKEGETRHTVKRSLNHARIVTSEAAAGSSAPQEDPWAQTPASEELPF